MRPSASTTCSTGADGASRHWLASACLLQQRKAPRSQLLRLSSAGMAVAAPWLPQRRSTIPALGLASGGRRAEEAAPAALWWHWQSAVQVLWPHPTSQRWHGKAPLQMRRRSRGNHMFWLRRSHLPQTLRWCEPNRLFPQRWQVQTRRIPGFLLRLDVWEARSLPKPELQDMPVPHLAQAHEQQLHSLTSHPCRHQKSLLGGLWLQIDCGRPQRHLLMPELRYTGSMRPKRRRRKAPSMLGIGFPHLGKHWKGI
mmetsp:Transcript_18451/g.29521  ORF Transcript_18451/g.29521 Transcript_18451/m.29521 type:complete len:254 (+) Transcript_18451:588-1349(+)